MKKLSKDEMKRILGGAYEGDKGEQGPCPLNCDNRCTSGSNCRCCHPNTRYAYCIDASNSCSS